MPKVQTPSLTGAKVIRVREMTSTEIDGQAWDRGTVVIEFDNGIKIFASRDDEGNGPGSMFGEYGTQSFYVGEE